MRLIDADRLKRVLIAFFTGAHLELPHISKVIDFLDNAPIIDAEPVRHGHWIYDQHRWICSECHENPTFGMGYVQSERGLYNYCPNCGAKMDEEAEHEAD